MRSLAIPKQIVVLAGMLALGGLAVRARRRRERVTRDPTAGATQRVVILGGGFGGMSAALRLVEAAGDAIDLLVLDRHNYNLFWPLLYQVAASITDPVHVTYPIRAVAARRCFRFLAAEAHAIDLERRVVQTTAGEIPYDQLVVAIGSVTNFYGNETAERFAIPLKSVSEAVHIRNRVLSAFERADATADPAERRKLLSIVIVGGGPTGLELAGALAGLAGDVAGREYPSFRRQDVQITVFEAGPSVLPGMPEPLKRRAIAQLEQRGVAVRLNTPIVAAGPEHVETATGERIEAATIVWAAGVRGHPLLAALPGERTRDGRVVVDAMLRLPGYPNVFVIGDAAAFTPPGETRPLPATAPVAIQEGRAVAENLIRSLRGQPLHPFRYRNLGNLVILGRYAGVADILGVRFTGFPAWLAWRLLHLLWLSGLSNKLAVLLDWATLQFGSRETALLEVEP